MTKEEHAKVLAALEESIDLVEHDYESDWRHGLPTRKAQLDGLRKGVELHKEAIAIMRKEQEPISDAEIEVLASVHGSKYTNRHYQGQSSYGFAPKGVIAFARALLEKAR